MSSQGIRLCLGNGLISISSAFAAESGPVASQPPTLPTAAAKAVPMADIHDIKPPLNPGADLQWLYWALAIALVILLAALALHLWKKRKKPTVVIPAPPPVPAETEAMQMLDALAADSDLAPKKFYFRLSAILRRYIERRYEIPAAEMTTEELLPQVDRLPIGVELAQPLKAFCRGADPIKFAGASAARDRMAQDLAFARDFVRQSTNMLKSNNDNGGAEPPPATLPNKGNRATIAEPRQRITSSTN